MKRTMNTQLMILGLALCASPWMVARTLAETGGGSHEGHAHNATPPAAEGKQTQRVPVTQEQVSRLGIKTTRAVRGAVHSEIRVPGEIKVNSDRIAHVVPQTPCVVLKVSAILGQRVKKGEVLAVISSRDLAEAKAEYLASVERSKLAQETYNREERLHKKKVSPEQDFLAAGQALAETQILERCARQKLLMLGVSSSWLPQLEKETEEQFASYQVVAPFDGTVIEKHIVLGEVIDEQARVFVVADLSTVWADLAISQDAISVVQEGHKVTIRLSDESDSETQIGFVSPIVDSDTRTALARATLPNPDGRFRPGTFVDASIRVPSKEETVVIPKTSVQLVNDTTCVFVWGNADFEVREVVTGVTDGRQIEILQGLRSGEVIASENAFHLKAEFAKSAAGTSGGHGHAH